MAKSKFLKANKKIEENVIKNFRKINDAVIENYTKIEDKFVDQYLTRNGETVADAKARLKKQNNK